MFDIGVATFVIALLLVCIALFLWAILRARAAPADAESLADVIIPWAQLAVSVAFEVSRKQGGLSGEERKAIALDVYDTLPDSMAEAKRTWLTRELFAAYVQFAYDLAKGTSDVILRRDQNE